MEYISCIFQTQTIYEAIVIGIITLIVGNIGIYFIDNEESNEIKKKKKNNNLNILFFVIGFVLHFIIEIVGINKWYCDKKCINNIKTLLKI
jgi:hypothetical protein